MLVDKPIPELLKWQGRNPCPADHEAYWSRALAELKTVDPAPDFRPAAFNCSFADCYDLYFTGVRNARIHVKFLRPKKIEGKLPAVFMFHGYSGNVGDWSRLLPYAAAGMVVAAMDSRGQGGLSEDTGGVKGTTLRGHIVRGLDDDPDNLLFRHIFLDTAQLVRLVSALPDVDRDRMGAFGGSQGGGLTIACAALSPEIRRAVTSSPFLSDYRRVWEMDLAKGAYEELKDYFRRFDPRHEKEEETFTRLGYIDVQFLAPRIRAEVIMHTGLMDTTCPPSSQFAAYNKISSEKKVYFYHDFGHEDLPGSHDMTYEFLTKL
jgi:cephalosporin-C deacetylase